MLEERLSSGRGIGKVSLPSTVLIREFLAKKRSVENLLKGIEPEGRVCHLVKLPKKSEFLLGFLICSCSSFAFGIIIMTNHRVDRVGMEIKREVNEILQKKVRDPRVQGVTITDVQMLGDLSLAKVYYTVMSDLASEGQKAQTGLEKATGTIKRELGKNLTMYKIPDLQFIKDESIAYGNKIDQMLRDLEAKK